MKPVNSNNHKYGSQSSPGLYGTVRSSTLRGEMAGRLWNRVNKRDYLCLAKEIVKGGENRKKLCYMGAFYSKL